MKRNIFTCVAFMLICVHANSQKYNLNKVTASELEQKVHPTDSSAAAAYLFKSGKVWFDVSLEGMFTMVQEVKCKIKIYKKEGYAQADVKLPFYTGGRTVRMFFNNAATYNLVDNKIERTKLKSDGVFEEKVNENYSLKKITLPNVKEGSIIEYEYVLKTPYFNYFPDWYFQHSIPVDLVEYEVIIPEFFTYKRFLKGFEKIDAPSQDVINTSSSGFRESKMRYSGAGIKAIKKEDYVNNIDDYTSMIQYELASTNFNSQGLVSYATEWSDVVKTIYDSDYFGKELDKTSYFEADLQQLLTGIVARDERIMVVFNYVQNRMSWNKKMSYYTDLGVKKAYNEKVGNVADINLMLVAMLRKAGIKCNPILVSTRSNGISLYPNRGAFNYVIAGVEYENSIMLLDATTKNAVPNTIPLHALNWMGRMIRENKTSVEVDLLPQINSKETITVLATIAPDGKVVGKTRELYYDYNSYLFREYYASLAKDTYLENLEKKYNGIEINNYTLENQKDLLKPIVESFDFTTDNAVEIIGSKMYFSPMLFFAQKVNPFKQETRDYPIDFSFPYTDKYNFTINFPEGYEIEFLPKPMSIAMEGNLGAFKYNSVATANQIQVVVTMEINRSTIPAEYYHGLKLFYKDLIDKQNEKIILKKSQ